VTLEGVGSDLDQGPGQLSYSWSSSGGTIDEPHSAKTKLSSATAGTFTVDLSVSDGELSATKSVSVEFLERPVEAGVPTAPEHPNILLIIADDLGAESTSLYPQLAGNSGAVPLPNIEALAAKGLVFDNAWASPVCSPTRGTIISGKYGYLTGVTNVGNVLPTSTVTLFDRLTTDSPSYEQAFFGKYHVGGGSIDPQPPSLVSGSSTILQHVRDLGITTFRGILGGGVASYFNWTTYDINGPNVATTTYSTTALTNYAIDFIHQHETAKPDDPWFIYQAYNAPHAANGADSPFQVPPRELHSVNIPNNPNPGTTGTTIPIYKANIQALDTEIGRLLAEVDLDKTVVIFIGDNGTPLKDTGSKLRGAKASVYEGGVRVPLIIAGAGVTRTGREDDLFVAPDLYATILELAGGSVPQVNNSYSLKPLLSDEAASSGRTHSFSEISTGTSSRRYAVRDQRYKLIYNAGTRELYDLVADPLETTNLYTNATYADARASLEAEIATLKAAGQAAYFP
jgi:arylsulfatase A-like enzyme